MPKSSMILQQNIGLCMQKIGVFFPMLLAPILSFGVVVLYCNVFTTENNPVPEGECHIAYDSAFMWEGIINAVLIIVGLVLYAKILSKESRTPLPMGKALWYTPGYCSVFTAENMVLNRRERDLKIKQHRHVASQESLPSYVSTVSSDPRANKGLTHGVVERAAKAGAQSQDKKKNAETNNVYLCTTMWHENKKEMHYLLASYRRIDAGRLDTTSDDKTNYEAHIMFDDAINKNGGYNEYANTFISLLPDDIRSMSEAKTPYGYQIQS